MGKDVTAEIACQTNDRVLGVILDGIQASIHYGSYLEVYFASLTVCNRSRIEYLK